MRTLARAAMFYAVGAAALLISAAAAAGPRDFVMADPPRPLPEIAVLTAEGAPETLAAALPPGRPAVLNLWATWCAPCVEELPALARLQRALGDAATVAALSVDRGGPRVVGAFLAKTGISGLTIRLDPLAESLPALRTRGLPTTLVLDREHREVARLEGPTDWDSPETVARLKVLMGLTAPAAP